MQTAREEASALSCKRLQAHITLLQLREDADLRNRGANFSLPVNDLISITYALAHYPTS